MMQNERMVKVNKLRLIQQIKDNKEKHKKEYAEAVEAYRQEAAEQLEKAKADLEAGKTDLRLDLVSPLNKEEDYDKLIKEFEWELREEVELPQHEFNRYVHDDFSFSNAARGSNTTYLAKWKK